MTFRDISALDLQYVNDLERHSRSSELPIFHRLYINSYEFSSL